MAKENLQEKSITIEFSHLNPILREIIGTSSPKDIATEFLGGNSRTIKASRRWRAFSETFTLINALNLVSWSTAGSQHGFSREAQAASAAGMAISAIGRTVMAKAIQRKHGELATAMKEFGIMQTRFEGNYPKGWINPAIVANTHPSFYVKANGDLVFPSQTRIEYARYVFQKKFPGKMGLNPWRWRAYLEKPEAPAKVKDIVNAKIGEWIAATRRKPAFGMAMAGSRAAMGKTALRRRL